MRNVVLITGLVAIALLVLGVAIAACSKSGEDPPPPVLSAAEHLGWKNPHCGTCHESAIEGHTTSNPSDCAVCHGANGACIPGLDLTEADHMASADCTGCHDAQHGFAAVAGCGSCHFAANGRTECGRLAVANAEFAGEDLTPDVPGTEADPLPRTPDPDAPQTPGPEAGDDPADQHEAPPDEAPDDVSASGEGDGAVEGGVEIDEAPAGPADEAAAEGPVGPVLSDAVVASCFGWPGKEFTGSNSVGGSWTGLGEGKLAVDLTLKDTAGQDHTLSSLLATKPVLMVFGAFT